MRKMYSVVMGLLLFATLGFSVAPTAASELLNDGFPLAFSFKKRHSELILTLEQALKVDADGVLGVDLSDSEIDTIPHGLSRFRNLRYLDLSGNRISLSEQDVKVLAQLTSLEHIILTDNSITAIPDTIAALTGLTNLVSLGISYNPLESVPPHLYRLRGLKALTLIRTRLRELPDGISGLTNLLDLTLSFNAFQSFPRDFDQLKVRRLSMSKCQLSAESFPKLPKSLDTLELSFNKFATIPTPILDVQGLENLFLNGNEIRLIPKEIADLKHLKRLSLVGNKLTGIPAEVADLSQLEILDVGGNEIRGMDLRLMPLVEKGIIRIDK